MIICNHSSDTYYVTVIIIIIQPSISKLNIKQWKLSVFIN